MPRNEWEDLSPPMTLVMRVRSLCEEAGWSARRLATIYDLGTSELRQLERVLNSRLASQDRRQRRQRRTARGAVRPAQRGVTASPVRRRSSSGRKAG